MRSLLALLLVLVSTPTLAQKGIGSYVGVGLTRFDHEVTVGSFYFEDTKGSYKIYGGYRFNETMAFDAGYSKSGGFTHPIAGSVGPIGDYEALLDAELELLNLRALVHARHVFFGLGYFDLTRTATVVGQAELGAISRNASDSDNGYSIAIGGQWDVARFGIRAEYEYFKVENPTRLYTLGIGVQYGF